jgi:hypothetical protein
MNGSAAGALAPSMNITQPEPGTMVWITPSGRSYATGPTVYPV